MAYVDPVPGERASWRTAHHRRKAWTPEPHRRGLATLQPFESGRVRVPSMPERGMYGVELDVILG